MTRSRRTKPFALIPAVAAAALALGVAAAAFGQQADDRSWSLSIEPMFVDSSGHDQRVIDVSQAGSTRAIDVTVDSGPGYHLEFRRGRGRWSWGLAFFWFSSPQSTPDRTAAATGDGETIVFESPAGAYVSSGADETVYYRLLEDNDIAAWTADFFFLRRLRSDSRRTIHFLVGLRTADFDNDYRAVVGVEGDAGTRFDSSSNYERMNGPVLGIVATRRRGASTLEGSIEQAVVLGDTQLFSSQSDFVGSFIGEAQEFTDIREFAKPEEVTIPITEVRGRWSREISSNLSLSLGLHVTAWWNVSVPPGVEPTPAGLEGLRENSIVFYGLFAGLELR